MYCESGEALLLLVAPVVLSVVLMLMRMVSYMSMSKSNIPVSSSTVPIDAKEEYVYCCSALGRAAVVAVVAATA